MLRELNAVQLSVCKIKSKRCSLGCKSSEYAFSQNLFVEVANVVCTGQNANAPLLLKIINRCYLAKIYVTLEMPWYKRWASETG